MKSKTHHSSVKSITVVRDAITLCRPSSTSTAIETLSLNATALLLPHYANYGFENIDGSFFFLSESSAVGNSRILAVNRSKRVLNGLQVLVTDGLKFIDNLARELQDDIATWPSAKVLEKSGEMFDAANCRLI